MLLQMKAIRQGLAVELCIAAFIYLDDNKLLASLLLLLIAFLFIILLLLLLLLFFYIITLKSFTGLKKKIRKNDFFYPIIWTAFFLIVFSLRTMILDKYLKTLTYSTQILRFSGYLRKLNTSLIYPG
jgi:4-amino-4-deoxy-L-arabinose transferase-like glycosyltransferase